MAVPSVPGDKAALAGFHPPGGNDGQEVAVAFDQAIRTP